MVCNGCGRIISDDAEKCDFCYTEVEKIDVENNIIPSGSILTPKKTPRKTGSLTDGKTTNSNLTKSSFVKFNKPFD